MAITYTPNLHLGLQEYKEDNFDWDVITDNWEKIDAALGKAMPAPCFMNPVACGTSNCIVGVVTFSEVSE